MCSLTQFVVKYVLIIINFVSALAGLIIIGLGTYGYIQITNEIHDVMPAGLDFLTINIIVIGCIVFLIAFCACCGAMQESRCMLISYAVFMTILAGLKTYFVVLIFKFLDDAQQNVSEWLNRTFSNENVRPAYNAMEILFNCCGTTGASSYLIIGQPIPSSCCWYGEPAIQCTPENSFEGCNTRIASYLESAGAAFGAVLLVVILAECVCAFLGLFLSYQIGRKRYA